jgi:flagellar hook-associated protein 2
MGTITMSGFNSIDWNAVLEAVMKQESQPLTTMQTQRSALSSKTTTFSTLATKLSALETAASDLTSSSTFAGRKVTSSDTSIVTASGGSSAMIGTYDVLVRSVARAQVTTVGSSDATGAPIPDSDQTVVATGGSLDFHTADGDVSVTLAAGSYTLSDVASAINGTAGIPVRATIVQANGNYQLVLTGNSTGVSHAFTATNNLTGGSVTWGQANAMAASDADVTINNVQVTSDSNTITDAIGGVTLNLLHQSTTPVAVGVTEDSSATKDKVSAFITAYNDLNSFIKTQQSAALGGDTSSIGNDALLRGLRGNLSATLLQTFAVGGSYQNLAEIGLEFERDGTISLNQTMFDDAFESHQADVEQLLSGTDSVSGAFDSIKAQITEYTRAGGLVPDAKTRLTDQVTALDARISAMQDRLAIRRQSLLQEYTAADQLISSLNSQKSSLSSLVSTSA